MHTDERRALDELLAAPPTPTRRPTVPALEERLFQPLPVLDHGFVRLVDYMGDDGAIVQAARVSYGRGTRSMSNDRGLIRYLMRHRHTTPFEMCEIKLHVKLPIFVARQWIRHRTANVNEYSARYSIMDREFYSGGSALLKGREMTQAMLERTPELDFLYYSNDMIGAGGLLYLLEQGVDIPGQIGLAAFNNVELLQGLPRKLATMDAMRTEIGTKAAEIIAARVDNPKAEVERVIELTPKLALGDTLKHK